MGNLTWQTDKSGNAVHSLEHGDEKSHPHRRLSVVVRGLLAENNYVNSTKPPQKGHTNQHVTNQLLKQQTRSVLQHRIDEEMTLRPRSTLQTALQTRQRSGKSLNCGLTAVDNGWTELVVLCLRAPEFLEGTE